MEQSPQESGCCNCPGGTLDHSDQIPALAGVDVAGIVDVVQVPSTALRLCCMKRLRFCDWLRRLGDLVCVLVFRGCR
jgi:hypothetical protein